MFLAVTRNEPIEFRCVTFPSQRVTQQGMEGSAACLDGGTHEPKCCAEIELNDRTEGMSAEQNKTPWLMQRKQQ